MFTLCSSGGSADFVKGRGCVFNAVTEITPFLDIRWASIASVRG